MTIELLNLAKNYYTYRELAQIIGLPETVLSRYVKGHVLPSIHRAKEISKILIFAVIDSLGDVSYYSVSELEFAKLNEKLGDLN